MLALQRARTSMPRRPKTKLVPLEATAWPLPLKLIMRPVVAAGGITLYVANSLMGANGGLGFLFGMFVFLLVLFLPVMLAGVVIKTLRTRVTLDDGGMRLALRGARAHWPYSILGSAEVRLSSLGTDALVISDRTGRPVVEVPLLNRASTASAEDVALRFRSLNSRGSASAPPEMGELARQGVDSSEWCHALDELARLPNDPGFRERFLARDELAEILAAPAAKPEQRAAAAYVMLKSAESHRQAALGLLGPAMPPLVLALAERAAPGELPVTSEALDAAREYLDEDDRRALAPA